MSKSKTTSRKRRKNTLLFHFMLLVPVTILFIFHTLPTPVGILMAFQDFKPGLGFLKSEFIGFENFIKVCLLPDSLSALKNTLIIATSKILGGLFVAISFALLLNEVSCKWYKRTIQTITYLPHFLSWVVMAGILIGFLTPGNNATAPGLFNQILINLKIVKEPIYFLGSNDTFQGTIVVSSIWKSFGYSSIVYLAALTGIDPTLYEAARVDGAGRWKQTIHITLPGIAPIVALMSILSIDDVLNAGFDQIFNLYNPAVYDTAEIIDTLVYKLGIGQGQYSLSSAMGLTKSVVSCALVLLGYKLADKYAGYRVW